METIERSTPESPNKMDPIDRSTPESPNKPELFTQATTALGNTVARAGAFLPELPGGLADFIRRHPLPSLMAGMGLGFLLGRSCAWIGRASDEKEGVDQSEAGYPDALIQCLRCGQMVRQADMVSHSTTCRGTGVLSHGGSTS
jgi:hypothetical protein